MLSDICGPCTVGLQMQMEILKGSVQLLLLLLHANIAHPIGCWKFAEF